MWDWTASTSLDNPADICSNVTGKDGSIVCEGGTTILPGLEPTIFAVLTGASVCAMLVFWWLALSGTKPPPSDSHLLHEPSSTN
jgi:hypothetical protein